LSETGFTGLKDRLFPWSVSSPTTSLKNAEVLVGGDPNQGRKAIKDKWGIGWWRHQPRRLGQIPFLQLRRCDADCVMKISFPVVGVLTDHFMKNYWGIGWWRHQPRT
jgi:hypothetical protein